MPSFRILTAVLILTPLTGHAAERTATLSGTSLIVDSPCAAAVTIQPDPSLHGSVEMTASADHPEELDRLLAESGDVARLHTRPEGCWRPLGLAGFSPTLRIALRVPGAIPIAIDESGTASYAIGDVGGPLHLDMSGAVQAHAGHIASLTADCSGAGRLQVDGIDGPVQLDLSGHNEVVLGRLASPRLGASISGAGSLSVAAGTIGAVRLDDSGLANVRIDAVVGQASVELSGAGRVRFAQVTGTLTKEVSGAGSVTVGPPN